jgi:DNA-binding response OmpR family regulator
MPDSLVSLSTAYHADAVDGGAPKGNRNALVLVVDDEPLSRLMTRIMLEEHGMKVLEACDGIVALEQFIEHSPGIVLLDALMPNVDGFETCRAIRATASGRHVPILMLTGLDDEKSVATAYEAGASDFFVKSTHWTLLVQRCRYLLRAARLRADLVRSESRVSKAQRIARLGIWEWDVVESRVYASVECCELLDIEHANNGVLSAIAWGGVHPTDKARVKGCFDRLVSGDKDARFDCEILRRDGSTRVIHVDAEVEFDNAGKPLTIHGITQDITERCAAESQIRHLANYDSLTGLPNRRLFREQRKKMWQCCSSIWITSSASTIRLATTRETHYFANVPPDLPAVFALATRWHAMRRFLQARTRPIAWRDSVAMNLRCCWQI